MTKYDKQNKRKNGGKMRMKIRRDDGKKREGRRSSRLALRFLLAKPYTFPFLYNVQLAEYPNLLRLYCLVLRIAILKNAKGGETEDV